MVKDVADEEFIPCFKRSVVFIFASLLATYPLNYTHFDSSFLGKILLEILIVPIQIYLNWSYCASLNSVTISKGMIITLSILFSLSLNAAAIFPIVSDIILIVNQFFAIFFFTSGYTREIFTAYFIPLWAVGQTVTMSYGISQFNKYKKRSTNSVQYVLGLNDSQLMFFIFYLFAIIMNACDVFQGVKHLIPIAAFVFAVPGIYAQLDHKYKAANIMSLLFFALYFSFYHAVKATIAD